MKREYHALPAPGLWVEYEIACREKEIIRRELDGMGIKHPRWWPTHQAWFAKCRAIDALFDAARGKV